MEAVPWSQVYRWWNENLSFQTVQIWKTLGCVKRSKTLAINQEINLWELKQSCVGEKLSVRIHSNPLSNPLTRRIDSSLTREIPRKGPEGVWNVSLQGQATSAWRFANQQNESATTATACADISNLCASFELKKRAAGSRGQKPSILAGTCFDMSFGCMKPMRQSFCKTDKTHNSCKSGRDSWYKLCFVKATQTKSMKLLQHRSCPFSNSFRKAGKNMVGQFWDYNTPLFVSN